MALALILDEIGELVRATDQICLIEDAGCKAAEEAELPVFIDLAARAEHRRARTDHLSERNEVVLIPARAVQQEQGRRGAGFEAVLHS